MITEDYVSFRTAKLLDKKGYPQDFRETCGTIYPVKGKFGKTICRYNPSAPERDKYAISAPTLSLAQKWLREEKNIAVIVEEFELLDEYNVFFSHIINMNFPYSDISCDKRDEIWRSRHIADETGKNWESDNYPKYEEALEVGINKALELI